MAKSRRLRLHRDSVRCIFGKQSRGPRVIVTGQFPKVTPPVTMGRSKLKRNFRCTSIGNNVTLMYQVTVARGSNKHSLQKFFPSPEG
jgi:hypothetical protein